MTVLKSCPFCGGEAKRITLTAEDGPGNAGGDVVTCLRCQASSHVEFGRKENLVDRWNTRTDPERDALQARVDALVEAFAPDVRAVLDQLTDGEVVHPVDQIAADASVDSGICVQPARAGAIVKALRTLGIAEFGPLFAEEETANVRGSGYWLGGRGWKFRAALSQGERP